MDDYRRSRALHEAPLQKRIDPCPVGAIHESPVTPVYIRPMRDVVTVILSAAKNLFRSFVAALLRMTTGRERRPLQGENVQSSFVGQGSPLPSGWTISNVFGRFMKRPYKSVSHRPCRGDSRIARYPIQNRTKSPTKWVFVREEKQRND